MSPVSRHIPTVMRACVKQGFSLSAELYHRTKREGLWQIDVDLRLPTTSMKTANLSLPQVAADFRFRVQMTPPQGWVNPSPTGESF